MKNIISLIVCLFVFGCSYTVEPGNAGVVTDWGEVQDWTYDEGFHWVSPYYDVYEMSTQVKALDFSGDNHISVLSADRLEMGMDLSVQYRLHRGEAPSIFVTYYENNQETYTSRVVEPAARGAIRDIISRMDAMETVQQRDQIGPRVQRSIVSHVEEALVAAELSPHAIRIVGVQVRNIRLPERLRESINAIQAAENQALQRTQEIEVARQEAEQARIVAEGVATAATIRAQNEAEVRIIAARSNAEANERIARSLTPQLLELQRIQAQRAILSSDNTTLILGGGQNMTPILDLGNIAGSRR